MNVQEALLVPWVVPLNSNPKAPPINHDCAPEQVYRTLGLTSSTTIVPGPNSDLESIDESTKE